jgi:hypothetical protein
MSRKELVDKYLNKFVSRKLLAFIIATIALFSGTLISGDWVVIAAVYIGAQAATDIIKEVYKSKSGIINE